jgi:glycosyltransferase involved in cell wall biosynthesis
MNKPATLIVLVPGFAKDQNDSTCLPAHQALIRNINQRFPAVQILILAFQYPFEKGEYVWSGNRLIAFGGRNRGGISRRWLWYKVSRQLDKLKGEYNVTGVLSFWAGECAFVARRWAGKNGIKHYTWVMGQDAKKTNRFIAKSGLTGSELLAISDFSANELKQNHGLNATVLPLGIEPQAVSRQEKEIDIIAVGSLIPLKQYHVCINIIKGLKEKIPHIRMVICGAGPEREQLEVMIKENGLTGNLILAGEKDHREVLQLLQQSKLFLHPSSYEGLCIACFEALAAGLPVISFLSPMKERIPKWHVVHSAGEMGEKALSLLTAAPDHEPVHPYTSADTADRVMNLFGYQ